MSTEPVAPTTEGDDQPSQTPSDDTGTEETSAYGGEEGDVLDDQLDPDDAKLNEDGKPVAVDPSK